MNHTRTSLAGLIIALLLVSCGGSGTPATEPTSNAVKPTPAAAKSGAVTLMDVFGGGSYRCTINTPQGEVKLAVKENRFRYDIAGTQPVTMIAEYGETLTTYTYIANQDKWFKFTFPNAKENKQVITRDNVAQYPKYECERANIPESEFAVPEGKIVDQQALMAKYTQPK